MSEKREKVRERRGKVSGGGRWIVNEGLGK